MIKYLIPIILIVSAIGIISVHGITQITTFQTIQFNQTTSPSNPIDGSIVCYNQYGVPMINCFDKNNLWVITKDNGYYFSGVFTGPGTLYQTPFSNHLTPIESYARTPIESNGLIKHFDCLIDSNTMTGAVNFISRMNGGNMGSNLLIFYGGLGQYNSPQLNLNLYSNGQLELKINSNSSGSIGYTCHISG